MQHLSPMGRKIVSPDRKEKVFPIHIWNMYITSVKMTFEEAKSLWYTFFTIPLSKQAFIGLDEQARVFKWTEGDLELARALATEYYITNVKR